MVAPVPEIMDTLSYYIEVPDHSVSIYFSRTFISRALAVTTFMALEASPQAYGFLVFALTPTDGRFWYSTRVAGPATWDCRPNQKVYYSRTNLI
jgi:hypothetical protein